MLISHDLHLSDPVVCPIRSWTTPIASTQALVLLDPIQGQKNDLAERKPRTLLHTSPMHDQQYLPAS
jgi:hypothetical protein